MRTLNALVILAMLAGLARADDLRDRGRHKRQAAIAVFVIGSAIGVAGGALIYLAQGDVCITSGPTPGNCPSNPYWAPGITLLVAGVLSHAIAMPLYISGSNDIDRSRSSPPPATPLATVRF